MPVAARWSPASLGVNRIGMTPHPPRPGANAGPVRNRRYRIPFEHLFDRMVDTAPMMDTGSTREAVLRARQALPPHRR